MADAPLSERYLKPKERPQETKSNRKRERTQKHESTSADMSESEAPPVITIDVQIVQVNAWTHAWKCKSGLDHESQ